MRSAQRGIPSPYRPLEWLLGGTMLWAQGHDAMTRQEEEGEKIKSQPVAVVLGPRPTATVAGLLRQAQV